MLFTLDDYLLIVAVMILTFQIGLALLPNIFSGEKSGDDAYIKWLTEALNAMFIKITPKKGKIIIWGSTLGLSLLMFIIFSLTTINFAIFMAVAGFFLGRFIPKWVITNLRKRRVVKFNLQMVDGLTLLSNALKSGLSVVQGLENVAKQMPNPISQEFSLVLKEQQVGISLEEAFINLGKRVECEDVDMFVTSVIVLKETGGNLSETFDTIVNTIRERIKIQQKISALVSQGVMQGLIIFLMPFALGIAFYTIDPNHILPMFKTFIGWALIVTMLTLQAIGGLIMWKIVKIEV